MVDDRDLPTLGHHLFEIAVDEAIAQIPPDKEQND